MQKDVSNLFLCQYCIFFFFISVAIKMLKRKLFARKRLCVGFMFVIILFLYTITVLKIESYVNNKSQQWQKVLLLKDEHIGIVFFY